MPETSQPRLFDELARCREWIERAIEYGLGTHTFEDVAAAVLLGNWLLWSKPDACVVLEVQVYPRRRLLHVVYAGGKLATIKEHIAELEGFARSQGCDGITADGRPGWARVLGWKEARTTVVRNI